MWVDDKNPEDPYNRLSNKTPGAPSVGAGGGAAQPGGTTSNPSTQNPVAPQQPTQSFATVQDYIGANKSQGDALGQQFTDKLAGNLTNEKNTIDTSADQANNEITAGKTNYDPNIVSEAVSSPTTVANDPNKLNSFLGQWNAAYTGPQSFESSDAYTPATGAVTEAQTKQAEAKTTGGQQQLLHDNFGVYGQGNQGLDQTLLQNSNAYPTVESQAKEFGTIPDYLSGKAQSVDTAATKAATDTAAAKQQTQGAFANNLTNFQNTINGKVTAAQTAAQTSADKVKSDLAAGNTQAIVADLKNANLPPDQIASIQSYLHNYHLDYGTSPDASSTYTFNPATDITAANVASPEDYANAAAYGKLTGTDYSGVLNPTDAAKAGTAPQASTGLNGQKISDYLKGALSTQDKNLLAKPVNVAQDLGTTAGPAAGTAYAQKYLDAAKRQQVPDALGNVIDPGQTAAVSALRQQANDWLYQYNREGNVQGVATMKAILNTLLPGSQK